MRAAQVPLFFVGVTLGVLAAAVAPARAQSTLPEVVAALDLAALEGAWFEVASTGSWALRRCDSDTRHTLERRSARTLRVLSACTVGARVERRRGAIKRGRAADGRLAIRYAPVVLAWAPAAWSDFWVLAMSEADGWLLVGDRRRRSLAVFTRTVAPAESAIAQAMAAARTAGYDLGRLRRIPQPAGPGDLAAR